MTPEEQRDHLLWGLVGAEHREQYLNDAWFHASVDGLADLLPTWIEGMAARAAKDHERIRLALETARNPLAKP